jgi:hypothetical protein
VELSFSWVSVPPAVEEFPPTATTAVVLISLIASVVLAGAGILVIMVSPVHYAEMQLKVLYDK